MSVRGLQSVGLFLMVLVWAILLEGYWNGPNPWVLQYDFSGRPVSTISREKFVFWFSLFVLITNGVVWIVSRSVRRDRSLSNVNIPYKEFWVQPQNLREGLRRTNLMMAGVSVFLNMVILISVAITRLNLMGQLVNVFLGFVFILVVASMWTTYALFKPPNN